MQSADKAPHDSWRSLFHDTSWEERRGLRAKAPVPVRPILDCLNTVGERRDTVTSPRLWCEGRAQIPEKNPVAKALAFGVLAAFFWGTHSVIVRYLTADLHGLTIAVLRLYIAAAVLYLILKVYRHPVSIPLSDRTFLVTAFGAVTNYVFFHWGLEHTSASNAMMLENTAPFFVLILCVVAFRKKVTRLEILATVVAIVGVNFTVEHDVLAGGEGLEGDLLELLAGITWAIFLLGSVQALSASRNTIERISFLFNVFIVSALVLTPALFVFPPDLTAADLGLLVVLGVFPTAVAYYLWYEAAARLAAVPAALLFTLSVVFTFLNAHVFLGEALSPDMIVGAALIVLAVILSKVPGGGTRE